MKKLFLLLPLPLLFALSSSAQTPTLVSGQIKDLNGVPYSFAKVSAQLVGIPPNVNATILVNNIPTAIGGQQNGGTDVNGNFTMNLFCNSAGGGCSVISPSGTQWQFTINETGTPPPLGTGPQTCNASITITGSSQSISSSFSCPVLSNSVGSPGAVGPVINAQTPSTFGGTIGFSPFVGDNSTAVTQLNSGISTAAFASAGGIAFKTANASQGNAVTSQTANISISAGDTVCVSAVTNHINGQTVTAADSSGTNVYSLISPLVSSGSAVIRVFCSAVPIPVAATSVTISDSPAELISMTVVDFGNIGDLGLTYLSATGSSTAPSSGSITTQDANNYMVSFVGWINASTITLSANSGTLPAAGNQAATLTLEGSAAIYNTSASPGAVTNSGTLSATSPWVVQTVEFRSGKPTVPTVFIPTGKYNYTNSINPLVPTTIKGDPGTYLCPLGSAHAVDLGPTNLTGTNYQYDPYTIQDLRFTCGANLTEGIFINPLVLKVNLLNLSMINFGNSSGSYWKVFSNGENDDIRIDKLYSIDFDHVPRQGIITNNIATQMWVTNSVFNCYNGRQGGGACTTAMATTAIKTAGAVARISHNNFNFNCPNIVIDDSAGGYNSWIIDNYFEGSNPCAEQILFNSVDGIHILRNFFNQANVTNPIAANSGKTAVNMLVAYNYSINQPTANEFVVLNNLVGQTGNLAFGNMCATGAGVGTAPCPKLHTTGANITQWNADYTPPFTFSASTTATYNFLGTYNSAPHCVNPPNSGTTTFNIATTTSVATVTASASFTGTVNAICNPDAQ